MIYKKNQINKKKIMIAEEKKRKFLLEGNLWKVILYVTFPIIIYLVFQVFFNSYDILFYKSSKGEVDKCFLPSMNRIHLVKDILIPFGASIATAGVILVGRNYGNKNIEKMRSYLSQTFILTVIVSFVITILFGFFLKTTILKNICDIKQNNPANQTSLKNYYFVIILSIFCIIINTVFLALERAKGNNKIILITTALNVFIKVILSNLFWNWKEDITSLGYATLLAHAIVTVFAFWFLFWNHNNFLKIILKKLHFEKRFLKKLVPLAVPICISNIIFILGKLIISITLTRYYGSEQGKVIDTQLILAVSINNIFSNIINSFADSQNAIISQNLGQKNMNRVFQIFQKIMISIVVLAFLGTLIHIFCYRKILFYFMKETIERGSTFKILLFYETTGLFLTSFSIVLCNFLVCFKKTKIYLSMNLLRVFAGVLFLFILKKMDIFSSFTEELSNFHKVGLSLLLGNLISFIATLTFFIPFYRKLQKENLAKMKIKRKIS
ncbi:Na+-driven multidrug efflux pump [Candidatus Phytoplasma australiense]|uniref:Na+-driven multidrug efflux pump n=2 Tax=Phytoplasma australiense TaxID=59748 RepID=B1V974_PHYAS|nr:MATE family efflux transporter [Candidatus Phytoplasma australiense]CAM11506.1 Na+-driven multidrug efflux pump [Candidatus Phytoplasma australiense]